MEHEQINSVTPQPIKKSRWKKTLRITLWTLFTLSLIAVGSFVSILTILTPERLTPLAEKISSQYLLADVELKGVKLTFWETFPRLTLEVDSTTIVSHGLKEIDDETRRKLPSNADTLLTLGYFHGGINLSRLALGELSLYDIEINRPMVNLVSIDENTSNFNIIPPSEDTTTTELPIISIDHFAINEAQTIRYFSLCDSIDVKVKLNTTMLDGSNAPTYSLAFESDIETPLLEQFNFNPFTFGLNGCITWNQNAPYNLTLTDFKVDADIIHATINTSLNFNLAPTIETLSIDFQPIVINDIIAKIPSKLLPDLSTFSTNATIKLDMALTESFNLNTLVPHAVINMSIPNSHVKYDMLDFHRFETDITATLKGLSINDATIDIKKLNFNGMGINSAITCRLSSLLNDPYINGTFKGDMNISRLPRFITDAINGTLSGKITANTQFKLRKSYLNQNQFHRAYISGDVTLNDFRYNASDSVDTDIYANGAQLKFGTSESFVRDTHRADSLLAVSLKIDTASIYQGVVQLRLSGLKAGIGGDNRASTSAVNHDSTFVNPIGGTIRVERFNYLNTSDSSRMRMRNIFCFATLRRFKQQERVPELILKLTAGRLSAGNRSTRINLSESDIFVTAHLKPRREMPPQMKLAYDSISKLYPNLSIDSVFTLTRKAIYGNRRQPRMTNSEIEMMDFGLDNSTKNLFRRWALHGEVKAKRARVFTPYFPLRNSLSNINIEFNTDSLTISNTRYRVGRSDFLINGSVRDIRRALTSRRGTPIKINFDLASDTIDVNQLAEAMFTGAAYSQSDSLSIDLANIEDDAMLETALEQQTDTTATGALLIPVNINAALNIKANNIIYGNMPLKNFSGKMLIYDGALKFNDLTADTDIGNLNLSALYSAPSKRDMRFGFGMKINDFHIEKFLDLMPAVDSIMPMMKDFSGIINADIAATADVDTAMNLVIPSLHAAVKLDGDSLVLLDAETFKFLSKWLLFKNKKNNMIDHMTVEFIVENSMLEMFPFMFDIDRYRLGIMGHNDLAMNYNYHVSVLKSPLPFKFGINLSGNIDDMKIRVGKAKFNENTIGQRISIVDTTRVNLLHQIENVFRRGIRSARFNHVNINRRPDRIDNDMVGDTISRADSLIMIEKGMLDAPAMPQAIPDGDRFDKLRRNNDTPPSSNSSFAPLAILLLIRKRRRRDI